MITRSIKPGRAELCTIVHEGREYTAMGSSVHGSDFTAYESNPSRDTWRIRLTNWDGSKTILVGRRTPVDSFRSDGDPYDAIVIRLAGGRFLIGCSMGPGMLFRGEAMANGETFDDAAYQAKQLARRCMDRDWEDIEAREDEDVIEQDDDQAEELIDLFA